MYFRVEMPLDKGIFSNIWKNTHAIGLYFDLWGHERRQRKCMDKRGFNHPQPLLIREGSYKKAPRSSEGYISCIKPQLFLRFGIAVVFVDGLYRSSLRLGFGRSSRLFVIGAARCHFCRGTSY